MSVFLIPLLLATCSVVFGTLPTPTLNVTFIGIYSEMMSYATIGGRMHMECNLNPGLRPSETLTIQLVELKATIVTCEYVRRGTQEDEENEQEPTDCPASMAVHEWIFGNYSCIWRNATHDSISKLYDYRNITCNDSLTSCLSCNRTHPWCLITPHETYRSTNRTTIIECSQGPQPCDGGPRLCPSGERSMCDPEKNASHFLVQHLRNQCPKDVDIYVWYDGAIRSYQEFFPVRRKSKELKVARPTVESGHFFYSFYPFVGRSDFISSSGPDNFIIVELDPIFKRNGSSIVKLTGFLSYRPESDQMQLELENYLIFVDTTVDIKIVGKNHPSLTAECKLAHLRPEDPVGHLIENVRVWWTSRSGRTDQQTLTFHVNDSASIYCHLNVSYRICKSNSAFWEYENVSLTDFVSQEELFDSGKSTASQQSTLWGLENVSITDLVSQENSLGGGKAKGTEPQQIKKEEEDSGLSTETIIYIVSGVILGSLILAAVGFASYKGYKKWSNRAIRNKELQATYKEEMDVMEISDVRQMAGEVIGSKDLAQKVLSSIKESSGGRAAKLETVSGCLHPKILLLSSTKINIGRSGNDGLHMTELADYHGHTMVLSQNPTRPQLEKHLNAIWNKRIGTVVIASEKSAEDRTEWQECFSPNDGGRMTLGKFETYTEGSVKSSGEFDQYVVEATLKKEKRKITFMYIDPSITPSKYAEIIEMVNENQEKKLGEGLPGVLFQDPTGTHCGAALLTAFIGRQMWMRNKSINMLGLLRYVRRKRHGAFEGEDGVKDLQIVAGVMQIIATRTEMGNVGRLNVGAQERDVFDQRARRKELQELHNSSNSGPASSQRSSTTSA